MSIEAQAISLASLPEAYVSKRQDIAAKITLERKNLAEIDLKISALEQSGESGSSDINYAVWIRIAAMLLNAYLIHLFFMGFRFIVANSTVESKLLRRTL